jgi:ParB family chromosome partitioning protein
MAGKKPALGRGLESLFGDMERAMPAKAEEETGVSGNLPENAVLYVGIDEIKPNSMQPRQTFDAESIEELAASIESYGVIQPVILTPSENGYELVAGERRWRAARKAGLKTIPSIVRQVTQEENALIAIIENMQREDLNTIEEATAYKAIISKYKMTQEILAKAVGKSRPYIANTLRTLLLPPEVVELLRTGKLTLGHANALGAGKDADQQVRIAEKIAMNGSSVRETERLANAIINKKPDRKKTQTGKTNEIRIVEHELTSATGMRVVINGDGEKGSVELKYSDREGLEEIIDLLRKAASDRK